MTDQPTQPAIKLENASLVLGGRQLWHGLNLEIKPGEFFAVLGPNGAGKTSFLRVLLGVYPLATGTVHIEGRAPKEAAGLIGYIPQQKAFDASLPIRGRDLVHFGLDGHRYGLSIHSESNNEMINRVIHEVGADQFADAPIGRLSGGEQQRLRVAQAILGDPKVLLCDEPLVSLDLSHQESITKLINDQRQRINAAVVFVTHELNPIIRYVDRVLYFVNGRWAVGKPDEILTSKRLSELYGRPVDVVKIRGRVIIVASATGEAGQPPEELEEHQ